jgi:nitroimidazol reductase NimA-like FMN-containing flavoprotein (pyridoxamine 5'-phosphate oxidase superfamily)
MSTINQPSVPKPFIPIFEKAGIKLKKYETPESFEDDLLIFLKQNHVLHLSTCKNNTARSTPLEYRLDGLRFCILSAGGAKFDYLKANNRVSFSIAEPYDSEEDYWGYKGLQAWGTAEVISKKVNPEEFEVAYKKMKVEKLLAQLGVSELMPGMNYRVIRITPDRIKYGNPREGIFRVTWNRETTVK